MPLPHWQPAWTFFYFNFHFKSNAELVITNTDPALCTSAPTTGFNFPVIASVIARKFSAMGGVGSDIAVDAADIALVDDEVKEIPHLVALSKRMMTTI